MRKKKKWNKIIYCTGIILLGSSMALSLFACGKKDDETAVEQAVSQEETQNTEVLGERKSGRRETACPDFRKPIIMRVYSRNALSNP